jgi:hypothetical protein
MVKNNCKERKRDENHTNDTLKAVTKLVILSELKINICWLSSFVGLDHP